MVLQCLLLSKSDIDVGNTLYILINGLAVYLGLRASCGKIRNGINNSQALDTTVAQHHADDLELPGHLHDYLSTCDDLAFNARSFQADGNSTDLVGTQYAAARQVIAGHLLEYKQLHTFLQHSQRSFSASFRSDNNNSQTVEQSSRNAPATTASTKEEIHFHALMTYGGKETKNVTDRKTSRVCTKVYLKYRCPKFNCLSPMVSFMDKSGFNNPYTNLRTCYWKGLSSEKQENALL